MISNNFIAELDDKVNAMDWFPDLCDNAYNLAENVSFDDLYARMAETYYVNDIFYNEYEKKCIMAAYEYLSKLFHCSSEIELEKDITKSLLNIYDKLVKSVSNYRFIAHRDYTFGDSQTRASYQIMLEVSMLRPVILMILDNIDFYLVESDESLHQWGFNTRLIRKLLEIAKPLEEINQSLDDAQEQYHDHWLHVTGRVYWKKRLPISRSQLGVDKLAWRKNRNIALQRILDFYEEMLLINMLLDQESKAENYALPHDFNKICARYSECISYITRSPYYYCYLSEEEKASITNYNKQRKIRKHILD